MRKLLGIVLLILGIPVLLVGAAAAVLVGTDDTVDVATETVDTAAAAFVVPSSVLGFAGPTLVVTAEVDGADTFIGTAHPVHVASYLDGVAHTDVTDVSWSREVTLTDVPAAGDEVTPPPPAELDWWQQRSVGGGTQRVEAELTEEPVSVVVTAAEPTSPLNATVTGAVRWDNLFVTAVVTGVIGLLLVLLGIMSLRAARRRKRARLAAERENEPGSNGHVDPRDDDVAPPQASSPDPGAPPMRPPPPRRPTSNRPPPPPAGGGQGQSLRIAGVVIPAIALVAGCAALPEQVDTSSPTLLAATADQNESFFAAYTEVNNEANAAQDPELLAAIETGPLLEASTFGFQIERAQGIEPADPFTVTPTALASPRFAEYPLFYLATATTGDDGTSHYLLTRPTATQPWRAAATVTVSDEQPFDLVAAVSSTPTVADADSADAGLAALDVVREYAETGEAPEGLDAEAAGSLADLNRLGYSADPNAEGIASLTRTCEVAEAVEDAWLTTDSGVMTIATATCTQELQTDEGYWFTPDADYGTISGGTDITETTVTGTVPFIARVSDDGAVVVHGGRLSLTQTDAVTR